MCCGVGCWCCVCTCGVVCCVGCVCVVLVLCCVLCGTRKTPPCVRSKRLRVYGQDVSVCTGTRRRPDRTHGGVLDGHTGVFSSLSLALSRSFLPLLFSSLLFSFSSLLFSSLLFSSLLFSSLLFSSLLFSSLLVSRSRSVVDCAVVCGVLCVVWVVSVWWWCCVMSCVMSCLVCCVVVVLCGVWCVGVLFLSFSLSLNSLLPLSRSLSFLFFPSSVLSSSFSSLFPSRQQTLCKALINKRDVQL